MEHLTLGFTMGRSKNRIPSYMFHKRQQKHHHRACLSQTKQHGTDFDCTVKDLRPSERYFSVSKRKIDASVISISFLLSHKNNMEEYVYLNHVMLLKYASSCGSKLVEDTFMTLSVDAECSGDRIT
mmetsp:Transcript_3991/g.5745  ORF Transcript_3991/g.5745 Transcript_3991/m.5745 type:complete len:126 (-) Transcript_3991:10-387(-)